MDKISSLWSWATEAANQRGVHTIALIMGLVGLVIGGIWGLIKYFSRRGASAANLAKVTAKKSSIAAGQNVTVHFGITPEEFLKALSQREGEVRKELAELKESEIGKRRILEKTLDNVYEQMTNLQTALEAKEAKLVEAYQALEAFKGELGLEKMQQARKALESGDTRVSENLFQWILTKEQTKEEPGAAQAAEAAYQLGGLAGSRIDYIKAQHYYLQATKLQPNNPQYLNAAGKMAYTLGRYQDAEPLYRRSLAIREKVLGLEHKDVAISLNNIAALYYAQGKYGDAEPLYRRALEIEEKALGPDHPDLATGLNNLATLYAAQGKYRKAEPLQKRALAIFEKSLCREHPHVATILNNLALLYKDQGRYEEAEPLYRRALEIDEKALGPDHPDLASDLNNLAALYRAQGKYGEAEPLCRRALVIKEKSLGPEHPSLATSLNNLAALYKARGKYKEAEHFLKRALAIMEKALGPEHPDVATCLGNYAILLKKSGRQAEAEPLEARAKAIRAKHAEKNPPEQD